MKAEVKALQSEIIKNIQGTKNEGKGQIEQKEKINIQ